MRLCRSFTVGTEAKGSCKDVSTRKIRNRMIDRSSRLVTSQLGNFSRLIVDLELGFGKGVEAGGVGFEKLLENLVPVFNDDLSRRARLTSKV